MQRTVGKAIQLSILLLHGIAVWRAAPDGTPEEVEAALLEMKNTWVSLFFSLPGFLLTRANSDHELAREHWTKFGILIKRYPLLHDTMRYSQVDANYAVAICQFVSPLPRGLVTLTKFSSR